MILIVNGMNEGFLVTRGFGDTSDEPPPTPPTTPDAVLGEIVGGLTTDQSESPILESE